MASVDYRSINRANWDERARIHARSAEYHVDAYGDDPRLISDVVQFDRPRLGDISGVRGVHLQCHIGTDTVSLSRLGARMTGLDLSPESLAVARELAARAGAEVNFVESEVYSAVDRLGAGVFDLVYTGIGALCWLPDIRRWADVVSRLLKPGGRLFLREGHPVLWSLDEQQDGGLVIGYPYFETVEPMVFDEVQTYVESPSEIRSTTTHCWNHGLAEIINALWASGLELTHFEEHRSVPWDALPGQMRQVGSEFELAEHPERLPLTYTMQAVKHL